MPAAGAAAGVAAAKDTAALTVTSATDELIGLSHRIHGDPEIAFEEDHASAWVAEALAGHGFAVETGGYNLPTAVSATAGSGPLRVTICAEYDALPGIGHACGHNVIAAAAVGAGLALAPLADDLGLTVHVLGTPAEEAGGGKILMMDRGAFDDTHLAMMVHPAPAEYDRMTCLAGCNLKVGFHGRSAHASAFPELGVNAADALTVTQVAIGLLRQHLTPGDQVHGIVLKGGDAANIVPEETLGQWIVRSPTLDRLAEVEPRVRRCFDAGAVATGCTADVTLAHPPYSHMITDSVAIDRYRKNSSALGRPVEAGSVMPGGSTDMANVSLQIPTIHPMLGLGSHPYVNHQPEFAAFCATPAADQATLDGATAMAWTCIDLATDEQEQQRLLARAAPAT